PYTPHPTPCTLHRKPCTLHPTPYTLHHNPQPLAWCVLVRVLGVFGGWGCRCMHSNPQTVNPRPHSVKHDRNPRTRCMNVVEKQKSICPRNPSCLLKSGGFLVRMCVK
ncbi:hypothetical protein T484DRAFT_1639255, partial [Baffinella frigidus]